MREIKFRAWSDKNMHVVKTIHFSQTDGEIDGVGLAYRGAYFPIGMVNLMQFTGLKDKNGKEIYEGDIVRQREFIPNDHTITAEIVFSEGCFILNGWEQFICPNQCEVIGNIYENPELLKGR